MLACASAHAYAPTSPAETAHRGHSAADQNRFQEVDALSAERAKEKSVESVDASIERENYLRARYMDPSSGRFTQQDTYAGLSRDPASLHKYLYANADPVNMVDPGGDSAFLVFQQAATHFIGRAIRTTSLRAGIVYLSAARALGVAVGGLTYLSTRGQGVLGELQGAGSIGVQALQNAFLRAQPVITHAQATASANWRSFQALKDAMNSTLSGAKFNPATIQWHHVVGQGIDNIRTFGANAIHSLANVIPITEKVHGVITRFGNTQIVINGVRYSRFQDFLVTKSWERQHEIGMAILRQAWTNGKIDPAHLPL